MIARWAAASIRTRLTGWYAAVLTVMLVIYAAVTFLAVRHAFLEQLDEQLHGEFETAEERLSSQPTQSRLIDILAHTRGHREAVRDALADWLNRWVRATGADRRVRQATIDIDSFPIEVFGQQEGRAYNGYHQAVTSHPLVAKHIGQMLKSLLPSAWQLEQLNYKRNRFPRESCRARG